MGQRHICFSLWHARQTVPYRPKLPLLATPRALNLHAARQSLYRTPGNRFVLSVHLSSGFIGAVHLHIIVRKSIRWLPTGRGLATVLLYQAYSALADFRGILWYFLHSSILSDVGASTKPGAVQCKMVPGHFVLAASSRPALANLPLPFVTG